MFITIHPIAETGVEVGKVAPSRILTCRCIQQVQCRHMKPSTLVSFSAILVLLDATLLAQASFSLRNGPVRAPVYDWHGNLLAGFQWRAEVYGGADPSSLSPVVNYYDRTRAVMSFYRAGYFMEPPGRADVDAVMGVPCGGWAWLQVKVWDVRLGATYEEASARDLGGYGESNVFYARGGDPTPVMPTPSGRLLGLQSFSVLQEVPEPSVWVLVAVGFGGLRSLRRRPAGHSV